MTSGCTTSSRPPLVVDLCWCGAPTTEKSLSSTQRRRRRYKSIVSDVQLVSLKMATVSEGAEVADVPPEGVEDNGRFNYFTETTCFRGL